jgi:ribosomal protein S18 acetylase RimI-like enzyme
LVLELSSGLSPQALDAIASLERRTIAVDGGRLKLEWGTLRSRSDVQVNDLLLWDGELLVGFLGIYCFDGHNAELVGMVDPTFRRRGIARALIDAAESLCHDRSYASVLLVVPRHSLGGQLLARNRGATLHHSEHALVLGGPILGEASELHYTLRSASVQDASTVTRLLAAAFGYAPDDIAERLATDAASTGARPIGLTRSPLDRASTLIIEADGNAIGTIRLTREGNAGGVYGFAIDPTWQGRGIGRTVLREVCEQLRSDGAQHIGLEVATENERALGLYTSVGFTPVTTEDYFSLTLR